MRDEDSETGGLLFFFIKKILASTSVLLCEMRLWYCMVLLYFIVFMMMSLPLHFGAEIDRLRGSPRTQIDCVARRPNAPASGGGWRHVAQDLSKQLSGTSSESREDVPGPFLEQCRHGV